MGTKSICTFQFTWCFKKVSPLPEQLNKCWKLRGHGMLEREGGIGGNITWTAARVSHVSSPPQAGPDLFPCARSNNRSVRCMQGIPQMRPLIAMAVNLQSKHMQWLKWMGCFARFFEAHAYSNRLIPVFILQTGHGRHGLLQSVQRDHALLCSAASASSVGIRSGGGVRGDPWPILLMIKHDSCISDISIWLRWFFKAPKQELGEDNNNRY